MIATIETQGIPEPGVLERWENEGGSTRLLVLAPHEVNSTETNRHVISARSCACATHDRATLCGPQKQDDHREAFVLI